MSAAGAEIKSRRRCRFEENMQTALPAGQAAESCLHYEYAHRSCRRRSRLRKNGENGRKSAHHFHKYTGMTSAYTHIKRSCYGKQKPTVPWGTIITCSMCRWVASLLLLCFQRPRTVKAAAGGLQFTARAPASLIRNVGPYGPKFHEHRRQNPQSEF